MKVLSYNPNFYNTASFGTNCRSYIKDDKSIGTQTYMFREDLEWNDFTNFITRHFRNKNKVNIIQFASSDGSEAYTQIINLLEKYPKTADKFFPIQAYDIDEEIVKASKSGIINIDNTDKKNFKTNNILFEKYFTPSNKQLLIENDEFSKISYTVSCKVADTLTSRVNFNHGNMFNIIKRIKDESNTIVMCRNILGYYTPKEVDQFLDILSSKLKSRSIFVVGFHDTKDRYFDRLLQYKGFKPVMENVYRRI